MPSDLIASLAILVIKVTVYIYDIITFPIYYVFQKPWIAINESEKLKSRSKSGKPEGPYVSLMPMSDFSLHIKSMKTMYHLFETAVEKYQMYKILGTREILQEDDETQPNGRVFKKFYLGDYMWDSYDKVSYRVNSFAKALHKLGIKPKDNVVLFAETRAEWIIACIACFKSNITVTTLYANLGDDALVHGINETESSLVITSYDLLSKLDPNLSKTKVKRVICMEGFHKLEFKGLNPNVTFNSFSQIEEIGQEIPDDEFDVAPPTPDDTAIIMYTSGSTGVPKGVIITQKNLVSALSAFSNIVNFKPMEDIYIAYLPLAHVLELLAEFMAIAVAIPIGYSSPLTLTDKSSKVKRGCQGDASILQPTFMATVPLILDRMFKTANDAVNDKGGKFIKGFFDFAFNYKLKYIQKGYDTPFLNRIVFNRLKRLLGGQLRLMATGGAPLSPDTQNYIKVCVSPLIQAYGLTETCAVATGQLTSDLKVGRVGVPLPSCEIMLANWDEGNYHVTDKPYPRGEVIIGGDHVSPGYYKLGKTDDFFEKDGKRWFRSGDIAEIQADGSFKIIDRKKDLLKLQFGEYVSLGKVEAELKTIIIVDNVCMYGESTKDYMVALIVPNQRALIELGKKLEKADKTFEQLCNDPDINKEVQKQILDQSKKAKLQKFEIPEKIKLVKEVWLPDNDLVTAAYKLKRRNIQTFYQKELDAMYSSK
ncbi:hypothetical protein CHUAL_007947 [Chamberlinius hualienensis]